MSPTVEATSGAGSAAPGILTASARVQRLQQMAAELRGGPASFAAALASASGTQSSTPTAGTQAVGTQEPAYGQGAAQPGVPGIGIPQTSFAGYGATPTAAAPLTSAATPSAPGGASTQYTPLIEAAAARNGVDPAVLHGLIQQESDFDPNSRSSAGAIGLTQLMPSTASSLGVSDPTDPAQSIEGGARYLGEMLQRFGGNVEDALAAYNAGPGAVQRYGGVPPYTETQQYVSKVLGYAAEYRSGAGA
ncbi:MAG TPA: lytic transglycosylase domain-containing protein [Solirubrobacteraceae bacterium]|nr:lytic transglycosylase domain-containing protein [Solirubrobacteraceae bacterium]